MACLDPGPEAEPPEAPVTGLQIQYEESKALHIQLAFSGAAAAVLPWTGVPWP